MTTELVLQGIRAGKVPADTLACEIGETAWRSIRTVDCFSAAIAKLSIDGPTLVDVTDGPLDADEPPTLTNTKLQQFEETEEHTLSDCREPDDFVATQGLEEQAEVTIVEPLGRHSEPPPVASS